MCVEKTGFYRQVGKMGRNLLTHHVACIVGLIGRLTECFLFFLFFLLSNSLMSG